MIIIMIIIMMMIMMVMMTIIIIIIIIRNLYSAIMPLGGYRGAGGTGRQNI